MKNTVLRNLLFYCGILIILSSALISSCSKSESISQPDNLIPEPDYIDLLVEMQYISTYRNALPNIIKADSLKALVYEEYNITEEQFLTSHQFYQEHIEQQLTRIDEVIRKMEQQKQYIAAHIDSMQNVLTNKDSLSQSNPVKIE